jgi:trimeric autotransporter adhesin
LTASGGGSGSPIVFSADPSSGPGVCTVSGATVTYTAEGSCVIDANQAGNAHYSDAPQVQRTVTVNAVSQSISFTAPATGMVRGSATLSATGGGSGNPVMFSSGSPGVCTVSGAAVAYTAAGSCVIDANQAGNARYADAPQVQRTIAVGKIPQSISFTAPSSGALWSAAGLTATGGRSGNPVVFSFDRTSGPRVCRVSGTTVTYTAEGTCVIDANQAGNAQYADAPQVQRTIRVIRVLQYRGVSSERPSAGT